MCLHLRRCTSTSGGGNMVVNFWNSHFGSNWPLRTAADVACTGQDEALSRLLPKTRKRPQVSVPRHGMRLCLMKCSKYIHVAWIAKHALDAFAGVCAISVRLLSVFDPSILGLACGIFVSCSHVMPWGQVLHWTRSSFCWHRSHSSVVMVERRTAPHSARPASPFRP